MPTIHSYNCSKWCLSIRVVVHYPIVWIQAYMKLLIQYLMAIRQFLPKVKENYAKVHLLILSIIKREKWILVLQTVE